jgi:hypothetical protein
MICGPRGGVDESPLIAIVDIEIAGDAIRFCAGRTVTVIDGVLPSSGFSCVILPQ